MEGALFSEDRSLPMDSSERRPLGFACKPGALATAGLVLLAVGIACLVVPFAVRFPRQPPAPTPAPAAPLPAAERDALLDPPPPEDLRDCGAPATDPQQYAAAVAQAEQAAFGSNVTAAGEPALQVLLDNQPRLRLPLLFWALHSRRYPYSRRFPAAATTQVAVLNAAFGNRSGIQFSLAVVVPVAVPDAVLEGCASVDPSSPGYAVNRLVSSPDSMLNVLLCEPEGVHGATAVLGSSSGSGTDSNGAGAVEGSRILLQRAALWQSGTSLVHQMGHFLGLAHPFHERGSKKSCGTDADAIPDTPRQYLPNVGCTLDGNMHACEGEDGPLPIQNYMDLTNDTCRVMFTVGQMVRIHAMARRFRPLLYSAAARRNPHIPLPLLRAYQSGLPPPAVILAQQELAAAEQAAFGSNATTAEGRVGNSSSGAAAGSDRGSGATAGGNSSSGATAGSDRGSGATAGSGSGIGSGGAVVAGSSFWDASGQASLAASAADVELSSGAHHCSCLGADSQNHTFWVGELGGAYAVDAVRLLWRPPPSPAGIDGSAGCEGSTGAGEGAGLLCEELPRVLVDARVGCSPDPRLNARCQPAPVVLSSPLQQLECQASLQGRFVSVELAAVNSSADGVPCLCAVQPLSYLANPQPLPDAPASALAGALLEPGEWWQTNQSSTVVPAVSALRQLQPSSGMHLGGNAQVSKCSATTAEQHPWWALEFGLDPLAVRGLRLSLPAACATAYPHAGQGPPTCSSASNCTQALTASSSVVSFALGSSGSGSGWNISCPAPQPIKLTVLVGDSIEGLLTSRQSLQKSGWGRSIDDGLCAVDIPVIPGRLFDIDCKRLIYGTAVLVSAQLWGPAAAPLELCEVEVLGAEELAASLQAHPQGPAVHPASLRPYLGLPVDGSESTCLQAPSQPSTWALALEGPHKVLGLIATGSGGNTSAALLGSGSRVWMAPLQWSGAGQQQQTTRLEVGTATPALWLMLHNFSSLCEVRLFSASPSSTTSYALHPSPAVSAMSSSSGGGGGGGGGSSNGTLGSSGSAGSGSESCGLGAECGTGIGARWTALASSGREAGSVADGSYRTCFGTEQGEGPWVLLRFGANYRIDAVTLVSDQLQPNLTLYTLPPGATAGLLHSLGLTGQDDSMGAGHTESALAGAPGQAIQSPLPLAAALRLSGAQQYASGVRLEPWASKRVRCQLPASPIAEAQVVAAQGGEGEGEEGPQRLRLCELGLAGRAAAPVL